MTLDQRQQWIKKRFGDIDETILGKTEELTDMVWPDIVRKYSVKDKILTYCLISDIRNTAERIAEIYRNGAYEMTNNSEIEWHHHPDEIIRKVETRDWNFYGCYMDGKLIAVESMYMIRGDRAMEWVWGCVDPVHRGRGVWQHMGVYNDLVVEMSGAQVGSVWVVTTHKYSQMSVEKAGYMPMGCFIGKRLYGGSDNRYYRHTLIHYAKLYGKGKKHLQTRGSMQLTEKAAKLIDLVTGFQAGNTV